MESKLQNQIKIKLIVAILYVIGKVNDLPTYCDRMSGLITYHILHLYTDNFLFSPLGPPRHLCNLHYNNN